MLQRVPRFNVRALLPNGISSADSRLALGGAAACLVLGALVLRGWALYGSWFYLDDFNLLRDAREQPFGVDYLLEPYNSHLMPGGRALASLVASAQGLSWGWAATTTLTFQGLAGVAAVWMLVSLFGWRWAVLGPLTVYLASAVTVPAMMWWTASVNQVPLQAAFFLAVGAWVRYLRSRSPRWLLLTVLSIALGLCFYVKALLLVPVLTFLALAYFAEGGPVARVRQVAQRYWLAVAAGAVVLGGYLAYYLTHVDQPLSETDGGVVGEVADTMLGTAFTSGAVGGPWQWTALTPPNAFAAPPGWLVHLAWVSVVLVVLYGFLRRGRTLRAWLLLLGYLVGLFLLLVTSRALEFGGIMGLEYRYLTDAACVLALSLGLAFLPVHGAVQSSVDRETPLLLVRVPTPVVIGLVGVVAASGVYSTVTYVDYWHDQNVTEPYVKTLQKDLAAHGKVDLAEQALPEMVIPAMFAPDNLTSRLVPLLSDKARFPQSSDRLAVIGEDGLVRRALIGSGVVSQPGPRDGCGWPVTDDGRTIPLTGRAFDWDWWLRIGYLSSTETTAKVSAGGDEVDVVFLPGLNDVYVNMQGSFDEVTIDGLSPDAVVCVDDIDVGPVEIGPPLS